MHGFTSEQIYSFVQSSPDTLDTVSLKYYCDLGRGNLACNFSGSSLASLEVFSPAQILLIEETSAMSPQYACPPPFLLPFYKRGSLARPQLLDGGCWERGGDFFQGGCNFHIKNILKSEIFNNKKIYKRKYFSLS